MDGLFDVMVFALRVLIVSICVRRNLAKLEYLFPAIKSIMDDDRVR